MTSKTTTAKAIAVPQSLDLMRWLGLALAILGIGISGYLTYVKVTDTSVICAETETIDCGAVQNSIYSEILGIPVAILGLGAYLTIFAIYALEDRIAFLSEYGRVLLFSIGLFGVVYSGYLTYIEGVVLHKWCLWCVASALTIVGLFGVSLVRVMRFFSDEDDD